ncbi:M23 family peptidase, partial [Verminephrobacter sp. Larva24]
MMNRRAALAGTGSLLALDLGAKPPPAAVWPQALPVPGGVARLALGA